MPSEVRLSTPAPPRHGAPPEERPFNTSHLAVYGEDLRRIDRIARKRGLSLDDVMPRWRGWCVDNRVYPKNPAAHLTNFVKNHDPSKSK